MAVGLVLICGAKTGATKGFILNCVVLTDALSEFTHELKKTIRDIIVIDMNKIIRLKTIVISFIKKFKVFFSKIC
jgi:hypothetical protein